MSTQLNSDNLSSIKLKREVMVNRRRGSIKFIINMLIFRALFILIVKLSSKAGYSELYLSRFYYSGEPLSFESVYNFLTSFSIIGNSIAFVKSIKNPITLFFVGSFVMIFFMLIMLFTYLSAYMVVLMDILIPKMGSVVLWWVLYSFILGIILNYIFKIKIIGILILLTIAILLVKYSHIFSIKSFPQNIKFFDIKVLFK